MSWTFFNHNIDVDSFVVLPCVPYSCSAWEDYMTESALEYWPMTDCQLASPVNLLEKDKGNVYDLRIFSPFSSYDPEGGVGPYSRITTDMDVCEPDTGERNRYNFQGSPENFRVQVIDFGGTPSDFKQDATGDVDWSFLLHGDIDGEGLLWRKYVNGPSIAGGDFGFQINVDNTGATGKYIQWRSTLAADPAENLLKTWNFPVSVDTTGTYLITSTLSYVSSGHLQQVNLDFPNQGAYCLLFRGKVEINGNTLFDGDLYAPYQSVDYNSPAADLGPPTVVDYYEMFRACNISVVGVARGLSNELAWINFQRNFSDYTSPEWCSFEGDGGGGATPEGGSGGEGSADAAPACRGYSCNQMITDLVASSTAAWPMNDPQIAGAGGDQRFYHTGSGTTFNDGGSGFNLYYDWSNIGPFSPGTSGNMRTASYDNLNHCGGEGTGYDHVYYRFGSYFGTPRMVVFQNKSTYQPWGWWLGDDITTTHIMYNASDTVTLDITARHQGTSGRDFSTKVQGRNPRFSISVQPEGVYFNQAGMGGSAVTDFQLVPLEVDLSKPYVVTTTLNAPGQVTSTGYLIYVSGNPRYVYRWENRITASMTIRYFTTGGGTGQYTYTWDTGVYEWNDEMVEAVPTVLEDSFAHLVLARSGNSTYHLGMSIGGDGEVIFDAVQRNFTTYTVPEWCNP